MTKKLNTENIANELEGASLFFTKPPTPLSGDSVSIEKEEVVVAEHSTLAPTPAQQVKQEETMKSNITKTMRVSNRDTVIPRHHATTTPRYRDTTISKVHGVAVELVRKAVKEFGKEAATHRFTDTEKKQIADLIYTYKNQGIRTSENEITRIAVNFIMEDHRESGENSVLHKILEALNE